MAWCSSLRATTITGLGREEQATGTGRLTRGSSHIGTMLCRMMNRERWTAYLLN